MSALRAGMCFALTPEVLDRLKETGIRTVTDFLTKNSEDLSQKVSLPFTVSRSCHVSAHKIKGYLLNHEGILLPFNQPLKHTNYTRGL